VSANTGRAYKTKPVTIEIKPEDYQKALAEEHRLQETLGPEHWPAHNEACIIAQKLIEVTRPGTYISVKHKGLTIIPEGHHPTDRLWFTNQTPDEARMVMRFYDSMDSAPWKTDQLGPAATFTIDVIEECLA